MNADTAPILAFIGLQACLVPVMVGWIAVDVASWVARRGWRPARRSTLAVVIPMAPLDPAEVP